EVLRDAEPGEDAGHRRGLQHDEAELERRVTRRIVEPRQLVDARQGSREPDEEDHGKHQGREHEREVRERLLHPAKADRKRDVDHVRVILAPNARAEIDSPTAIAASAIPKPIASASASQPTITSERRPSMRYETGFAVAIQRNQSFSIRSRGMFIDERNKATKKRGKMPWTASGEPL